MSEKKQKINLRKNQSQEKEIIDLKERLKKIEEMSEEYLNGWKRIKADYLNREKEIATGKQRWIEFANLEIVLKLLSVLDSFENVLKHQEKDLKRKNWVQGIEQIKKQLEIILKEDGVEKIKALGEEFNPLFHEALQRKGDGEKIIEEVQSGYLMKGKVIRPTKVIIE